MNIVENNSGFFQKQSPNIRGAEPRQPLVLSGLCNGTIGELIQTPVVYKGSPQIGIISLPVQIYSWAYYNLGLQEADDLHLKQRSKCSKAIDLYLQAIGKSLPKGGWSFWSDLLCGKGMASSTADIVATIRCLDALFMRHSNEGAIISILRQIERSDSVFLDCYALYLSGLHEVLHRLPGTPSLHVCYIDEGNVIDTHEVTPLLFAHYADHMEYYERNLVAVLEAFDRQDVRAIAACATQSAIFSQTPVPKRNLQVMLDYQSRFGADGIVVAHTGSLIGYLFQNRPTPMQVGELSAFFMSLGYQCRLEKAQL
ncbi:hypothetical protein ACQ3G6_17870 [Allorhizobium undicola]|uniref:GHMP family kinase ATP-binding protein n=1 Tax=Allorhizobium undicola TaxID=78527 RepID=UPI003D343297